MFAGAKRKQKKATKVGSTATVSETVYRSYPILPFRIVACTFSPTTFLEIAVHKLPKSPSLSYTSCEASKRGH